MKPRSTGMTWAPVVLVAAFVVAADGAKADGLLPPWTDPRDLPLPAWARSVAPKAGDEGEPGDLRRSAMPTRGGGPRGVTEPGATLPLFGARRGADCSGIWWLVGPLAWTCSDDAELSRDVPTIPARPAFEDGLPAQYYFTIAEGTGAFSRLESAQDAAPDRDLEEGWAMAVVEKKEAWGEMWGRTSHRMWVPMRDLAPAHPSTFQGQPVVEGRIDFAWVNADRAGVWSQPAPKGKPVSSHVRLDRVSVLERSGPMVRIGDGRWMRSSDLVRPATSAMPAEVRSDERWIDVDLSTQTLVAYQGAQPVFATLVSTGRGGPGTDAETPVGVHRIWVKMKTSDMSSAERGETDAHYSLEDVPYVQFFDGAVALHGTYWHRDFGHIHSHGCVNVSPLDARWLFTFTEPFLPNGWVATYPTALDGGTVVRVH